MLPSAPETRDSLLLQLRDSGDVQAWGEFVRMYGQVLGRVARGRGFQPADVDNLIQEVLFAVAQSVASWLERDDRGSFRAWLLRIARNKAADMLTRRGQRPLGENGPATECLLNALPARSDVSSLLDLEYERAVFQWAAEQVQSAVAETTWQAFWLTHIEGLSIEDAARSLQTRPANIYFGRSRVMARIRQLVARYEDQP